MTAFDRSLLALLMRLYDIHITVQWFWFTPTIIENTLEENNIECRCLLECFL